MLELLEWMLDVLNLKVEVVPRIEMVVMEV